ncbi:hypothetical protein [Xenorhabdus anantnagensis]|uniref:Phage protein n=1 Tax=Xenorhabdus anantnagensis TaxID=3025875 RepID=A0ABT5LWX9_9GAMM|nr:hypothetical protein [Xenorhabdus anantnagensis]MDC9598951.1 hypothetical protein [Xenorhabdus anantnagensis]
MTDFTSLADGGELSRETWADFVNRLEYRGVDWHGAAYPSFTVRERVRVTGSEDDEAGIYYDCESYYFPEDLIAILDDEQKQAIFNYAQNECLFEFDELYDIDKYKCIESVLDDAYIFYWKCDYRTVNTHLTREAAEKFIQRKQHDYGELSVYVESFYWCWEMRTLIDGILTGKIKYIGGNNEK